MPRCAVGGELASSRWRTRFSYSARRRMVSHAPQVGGAAGTLPPSSMQLGSTDICSRQCSQQIDSVSMFQTCLRQRMTGAHSLAVLSLCKVVHGMRSGPPHSTGRVTVKDRMRTAASQLAARKKGVEKRSLLLTTLCSVDLKRPLVHLQPSAPLSMSPAGLRLSR